MISMLRRKRPPKKDITCSTARISLEVSLRVRACLIELHLLKRLTGLRPEKHICIRTAPLGKA